MLSDGTINEGDKVTWTLFYVNRGTGDIINLQITDVLASPGTTYVASSLTVTTGNTSAFPASLATGNPTVNSVYDGNTDGGTNPTHDDVFSGTLSTLKPGEIIKIEIQATIADSTPDTRGINLRRKLPYGADPSLQGFQPIYQSILFRLTLVADTRTESNQGTATGNKNGGTAIVPVNTDNIDNATTGLPTNVTVPTGSVTQTQNPGTIDATTAPVVVFSSTTDYGDAPDTGTGTSKDNYKTTLSDGGASHEIVNGLRIGSTVDGDSGTQQNTGATADGTDEDGISSFPALDNRPGRTNYTVSVNVTNSTGSDAYLVGYIDFNQDGDFLDTGEKSTTTTVSTNATNPRSFNVVFSETPAGIVTGTTYARFRISSTQAQAETSVGASTSGEVEDYSLSMTADPLGSRFLCDPSFYIVTGTRTGSITSQLYRINRSTTPYTFNPIGSPTTTGQTVGTITYPTNFSLNAIGYNLADNYIYGFIEGSDRTTATPVDTAYRQGNIVRIDADGRVFDLGTPRQSSTDNSDGQTKTSLITGTFYGAPSGAMLSNGTTYVLAKEEANDNNDPTGIYLIDITKTPPTFDYKGEANTYLNDIFLNPFDTTSNRLYTIPENGSNTNPNRLSYFNVSSPTTGLTTDPTTTATTGLTINYGSQYTDSFGTVHFRSNASPETLYALNADGTAYSLAGTPSGSNHDGASCPSVEIRKAATPAPPATVVAGNTVTYTYQIGNARLNPVTLTFRDQLTGVTDFAGTTVNEATNQVGNVATFVGSSKTALTALTTTYGSVVASQGAIDSGTVSFPDSNKTLEISNMTIPAQTIVSFSVEVSLASGASAGDYFNQARLLNPTDGTSTVLPTQVLSDDFTTSQFQDPTQIKVTAATSTTPNLLLVKRITRLIRGETGAEIDYSSTIANDGIANSQDDNPKWPANYLGGILQVNDARPGDTVEYTIYFLNAGTAPANNVRICDPLSKYLDYIPNSYTGQTPTDGGLPFDLGLRLTLGNSTPSTVYLTQENDTPDRGQFVSPGVDLTGTCITVTNDNGTPLDPSDDTTGDLTSVRNTNGVAIVKVTGNVAGQPTQVDSVTDPTGTDDDDALGFIRFRAKVK